jgi:hypothetical protein
MAKLHKFLTEEYLPNTRPDIGVSSLPDGAKFYDLCLRFHTSSERYTAQVSAFFILVFPHFKNMYFYAKPFIYICPLYFESCP